MLGCIGCSPKPTWNLRKPLHMRAAVDLVSFFVGLFVQISLCVDFTNFTHTHTLSLSLSLSLPLQISVKKRAFKCYGYPDIILSPKGWDYQSPFNLQLLASQSTFHRLANKKPGILHHALYPLHNLRALRSPPLFEKYPSPRV